MYNSLPRRKIILSYLRSRLSDYTEAAEHVMCVIVEMYEQNKDLKILWEKQKTRINQKYRLSVFEQDCSEVRFLSFQVFL